ncbi:VOC family protein [Micrococcales bacterium 31B]|nr:VOC family protein [Micrococcales bacterium 31B]
MSKMIFINLPVTDLDATKAFYTALGCSINPMFTDDTAACIVWDDNLFVMALTREKFAEFTKKPIYDPKTHAAALYAVSFDSRDEVDDLLAKAVAAGGEETGEPQDHGFMYLRSFTDPEGHTWEITWMNPHFGGDEAATADEAGAADSSYSGA